MDGWLLMHNFEWVGGFSNQHVEPKTATCTPPHIKIVFTGINMGLHLCVHPASCRQAIITLTVRRATTTPA